MFPSINIYLIAAAAFVLISGGVYVKGRMDASSACELRHEKAQQEVIEKVRKKDDKIKKAAPDDTDKLLAINWLQQHVRQQPVP